MFTKEGLITVKELKLAGKLEAMTDRQFASYAEVLNAFIDSFPTQAENMRKAVDSGNHSALNKAFSDVADMLERIHATDMAKDERRKFSALGGDADMTEAFVEKLILNASSLSIDIQMSGRRAGAANAPGAKSSASVPQIFTAGTTSKPSTASGNVPHIFSAGSSTSSGRPVILAVDNAIMFLNTMKKLLDGSPYELQCATTGYDALQFAQNNRVNLFLLDIEMPEMDGYELARRIKATGNSAPIVFITANSAREYVDKAINVGAVGLLMKPVRGHTLLAKVKEFI